MPAFSPDGLDCSPNQSGNVAVLWGGSMPGKIVDRLANMPNLSKAALAELWEQLFKPRTARVATGSDGPHSGPPLQEQAFGGLASGYDADCSKWPVPLRPILSSPGSRCRANSVDQTGTRLVRQWQSRTYIVHVAERGYEYNGSRMTVSPRFARLITGTRRSGPLFFGLKESTFYLRRRYCEQRSEACHSLSV